MAVDVSSDPLLPPSANPGSGTLLRASLRFILRWSMWAIFLAWVSLFFFVPCEIGTDWYNDYVTATGTSLFGDAGSVLLLYGGPVLAIAILAIPYLLLSGGEEEELRRRQKATPGFRLSTLPVLVDGIFGVVTAGELIGIVLFALFVLWAVYAYTVVNLEMLPSFGPMTPSAQRIQLLRMSAYCFGLMALSCLAFLFLPVSRGSILLRLADIPFEQAVRYHIWLGNLTMFLLTMHGLCYFIYWFLIGDVVGNIIEWKSDGGANLAGIIGYSFGLLMWITTIPLIRRRYFELFFYTHQLYVLFVIFMALHFGDTVFSKAAVGIFLFMLDRFLRFFQCRGNVQVVSATCFPCGSVSLVVPKPKHLHFTALSFIFLRLREVSWLQWHPFSVSSSPLDGQHLSVLIKAVGQWTNKLRNNLLSTFLGEIQLEFSNECNAKFMASVEGPYGHESPYHLMYKKLILVAGGSGISPFLAIIGDILHRVNEDRPCLPKDVLVIWAIKKSSEISLLSSTDLGSICPHFPGKVNLDFRVYVTQESEPPSLEEGAIIKLKFPSTKPKEKHISPLVGTGNKIWAGIYVIVPSLGFAISLALLDVFYMNPYSVTAWWYRGLLFLGCMVASVVIFGGLVIGMWHLWEKTSIEDEEMEDDTSVGLIPGYDVLQNESDGGNAAEHTTVYYGQRPDFKGIFGSVGESWGGVDVGVIVCGPESLQSSVARECRGATLRRRANTPVFHFNSHSFSL
ncbi:hypothetical protein MLD38_003591 [Melastoma candidum]|uniref:Uncharacterized protein n=1 Tax=Melastoma candidum TaxID=119954 RepID=A0ACB9S4L8_9MYRT|nr:hypothetical protein MLD38_003591 [Melastoma candidum]